MNSVCQQGPFEYVMLLESYAVRIYRKHKLVRTRMWRRARTGRITKLLEVAPRDAYVDQERAHQAAWKAMGTTKRPFLRCILVRPQMTGRRCFVCQVEIRRGSGVCFLLVQHKCTRCSVLIASLGHSQTNQPTSPRMHASSTNYISKYFPEQTP